MGKHDLFKEERKGGLAVAASGLECSGAKLIRRPWLVLTLNDLNSEKTNVTIWLTHSIETLIKFNIFQESEQRHIEM